MTTLAEARDLLAAGHCSTRQLQAVAAALTGPRVAEQQRSVSLPGRSIQPDTLPCPGSTPPAVPVAGPQHHPTWHLDRGVGGRAECSPPGSTGDGRDSAALPSCGDDHWRASGPLVAFRAANAGAGASTTALALADAAAGAGHQVRLIDAAAPLWSGLIGASQTELGTEAGWRRGRRRLRGGASVRIDRVAVGINTIDQVPVPPSAGSASLRVLDVGWSPRELAGCDGGWLSTGGCDVEVLVTRTTAAALGQAELVLATAGMSRAVIVTVGASRLSRMDIAAAGPRLRDHFERGAVVCVPLLPAKAMPGLGPAPLPRPLMSAARHLLDQVTTITGPLPAVPEQKS